MTFLRWLTCVLLASSACAAPVFAEEEADRPKVGLVLSGGGARGGAHIGVLKALEEMEIKVDYIAGTSMGAIIGGMYAAGYSADEIEVILNDMDWDWALSDRPDRRLRTMRKKETEAQFLIPYRIGFNKGKIQLPLGAIEGQHLDQALNGILQPVLHVNDFDQLPIPFRALATDLVTGEAVVLDGGSLSNALRASMSVPGVFAPVEIEDRILVDGGMANNLPVSVAREMGADMVIAVDISSPLLNEEQLTSVLSVTEQLTNFLTRRTTEAQIALMSETDVLIVPDLGNFSAADFDGAKKIVAKGYEATRASGEKLATMTGGFSKPAASPLSDPGKHYVVSFIELDNGSVLNDAIIRSRLAVTLGEPLDFMALDESLDSIYSLDVFKSVTYDLVTNDRGEQGIVVHAPPRPWGPNYLQFGLELSSDFAGSSDFKLGAAYTRNALNQLGGEMRVLASMGREDEIHFDFYQPIDSKARWFVQPELYWARENVTFWDEDVSVAELQFAGWGASLGLGRNFSTTDQLRLTYDFGRLDVNVLTGDPDLLDPDNIDVGEAGIQYTHDSLDSYYFPSHGMYHRLQYTVASDKIGAAFDYQQAWAYGSAAFSKNRNNYLFSYELGYSFDDAAPLERYFRLGGFGRLSGLAPNQLLGRQAVLGTFTYYRRLNNMDLLKAYAGFTLEAGNAWEFSDEISASDLIYSSSLFVGAETPLGPVYVALGTEFGGDAVVYFYVGNPFRVGRFD